MKIEEAAVYDDNGYNINGFKGLVCRPQIIAIVS